MHVIANRSRHAVVLAAWGFLALWGGCAVGNARAEGGQTVYPLAPADEQSAAAGPPLTLSLLAAEPVMRPMEQGSLEQVPDEGSGYCFLVRGQQAGMRIDEPAFVAPSTTVSWSWKKQQGTVCIVQVGLRNPLTGEGRYLGYGAGSLTEPAAADPTVELVVSGELPRQWTANRRSLYQDMRTVLGWPSAQITSFYVSPWDGNPGWFRDVRIENATADDTLAMAQQGELRRLSAVGRGRYVPLPLKKPDDQHINTFETNFEECAPGRNSGSNEWLSKQSHHDGRAIFCGDHLFPS